MRMNRHRTHTGRLLAALLGALAGSVSVAHAQVISGTVVDTRTDRVLSEARVELVTDTLGSVVESSTTGKQGTFALTTRPTGPFRVRFSMAYGGGWEVTMVALAPTEVVKREWAVPPTVAVTYHESQVTNRVEPLKVSSRIAFPMGEEEARMAGSVMAYFTVDTTGLIDLFTVKVKGPTAGFEAAVLKWLPNARFIPADIDRVRVRQYTYQQFQFGGAR